MSSRWARSTIDVGRSGVPGGGVLGVSCASEAGGAGTPAVVVSGTVGGVGNDDVTDDVSWVGAGSAVCVGGAAVVPAAPGISVMCGDGASGCCDVCCTSGCRVV